MNWQKSKHIEDNKYELPGSWLHIHYFDALNTLFRIENSLRLFVYIILKDQFKDKWKDLSITSDDEESSTIGSISKRRIAQNDNHAYLGYAISSPLLHLTAGELIRIIASDKYWKFFKGYFLGSKEIIKTKLDEIGNVRNAMAHFRPIKEEDVELIKYNANHTLSKIEKSLYNFFNTGEIVPTNTEDMWYNELKDIGIDECKLTLSQSDDQNWVKVNLWFYVPILSYDKSEYGVSYDVLKFKAYSFLKTFPSLVKYILSVNESAPTTYTSNLDKPKFKQLLTINFSRSTIANDYGEIRDELNKMLELLAFEIKMIKNDHRAKGKLVEFLRIYISTYKKSTSYSINGNDFLSSEEHMDIPEFWGKANYVTKDYITETELYPWMRVAISEDKDSSLPF